MALPRVFISTDLRLEAQEKDDVQSLVHALMYQDKMNIVGIAGTASKFNTQDGLVRDIDAVIDVYGKDLAELREHGSGFKSVEALKRVSHQGATDTAPPKGYSKPTDSSEAIVAEARKAAAAGEKLNVLTWGGEADIAQALHDAPGIARHVRLFSIDTQDIHAKKYLLDNFKGKLDMWVDNMTTFRGTYGTPESGSMIKGWHEANAKGHGALGDFFSKVSSNIFNKSGVKMGDSPTVLRFLDGDQDDPTKESWGGEFRKVSDGYYTDLHGQGFDRPGTQGARTVYENREEWLEDFAGRFDWLKDKGSIPLPRPGGDDVITVRASGDHYKGNPNFVVKVDGKTLDLTNRVTAVHDKDQWQTFTYKGDLDSPGIQEREVEIIFNNDAWNGRKGANGSDRNLYIDEVSFNGQVDVTDAVFKWNSTKSWLFEV